MKKTLRLSSLTRVGGEQKSDFLADKNCFQVRRRAALRREKWPTAVFRSEEALLSSGKSGPRLLSGQRKGCSQAGKVVNGCFQVRRGVALRQYKSTAVFRSEEGSTADLRLEK